MDTTLHTNKRLKRINFIIDNIGIGKVIKEVTVDRGHRDGIEIHAITDTGIIIIKNRRKNSIITMLIARPEQIRRYYREDEVVPEEVIEIALEHEKKGYNKLWRKTRIER